MAGSTYRAEVLVAASPERVWAVLVDLSRYDAWNPFTVAVQSSLQIGAPVDIDVRLNGRLRRQREIVRAVEPGRCLTWGMQMGPQWLLRAERRQTLEPMADGTTRYVTEDRIEGWLEPVVRALYGASLHAGFAAMADALKTRAEA